MHNGVKGKLFRHHWWLSPVLGVAGATVLWRFTEDRGTLVVSVLAAVLSIVFFVQQQKLAEMQLFKQLIVEFNGRYDRLNDVLDRVVLSGVQTAEDRHAVLDYFNLCAEEYLFYQEGYIDQRVWQSWSNGMRIYFSASAIAGIWNEEAKTNSYYGFTPPDARG